MPISTDHNSQNCKQRRVCDACGEKQPCWIVTVREPSLAQTWPGS